MRGKPLLLLALAFLLCSLLANAGTQAPLTLYGRAVYENLSEADGAVVTAYPEASPTDNITTVVGGNGNTGWWSLNLFQIADTAGIRSALENGSVLVIEAYDAEGMVGNASIVLETGWPRQRVPDLILKNPDSDGDGIPNDLDNCPFDPNPFQEDEDDDDLGDVCDYCPGSELPESVPWARLLPNHYAETDRDKVFETALSDSVDDSGRNKEVVDSKYTLNDTYGCTCEQILNLKPGLTTGQEQFGCTEGIMQNWVTQSGWANESLDADENETEMDKAKGWQNRSRKQKDVTEWMAKGGGGGNSAVSPGHGGTPPGQDEDWIPPGQDGNWTPPGQDDTPPPGQDDTPPPGQDDTPPPGQDDNPPPGQDGDGPPGQQKNKTNGQGQGNVVYEPDGVSWSLLEWLERLWRLLFK